MFTRRFNDRQYKIVSSDGCGIELKVPRYKKTNMKIGSKQEAESKGLSPKGRNNFYSISDGSIVIDGYLSEISVENKVEMKVKGNVSVSSNSWEEIKEEIQFMLNFTEK